MAVLENIIAWCNTNNGFVSAVLALITALAAIFIPVHIARKQNKIALFEANLKCYGSLISIRSFCEFISGFPTFADNPDPKVEVHSPIDACKNKYLEIHDLLSNEKAILNAVSHRNYQFGGSIFVRQFRDRLVVESPGGLPFGITLDNILDRQLPRNRRIAEILSLCGMVERSGQGMNLMFELSIQEAKPLPDFTGTDDFFVSVTLNGLILDKAMLSVLNRISERGAELLSTEDFLVIDALYHERPLNEKMQSRLNRLIEMGIVEHIGRKKYVLARSLYAATGKTGVHTRHVGLDRDTNKELLLKHIRQNNEVGTPFRELQQVLPSQSRSQIQKLLRELRTAGKVISVGNTSAARWYITK